MYSYVSIITPSFPSHRYINSRQIHKSTNIRGLCECVLFRKMKRLTPCVCWLRSGPGNKSPWFFFVRLYRETLTNIINKNFNPNRIVFILLENLFFYLLLVQFSDFYKGCKSIWTKSPLNVRNLYEFLTKKKKTTAFEGWRWWSNLKLKFQKFAKRGRDFFKQLHRLNAVIIRTSQLNLSLNLNEWLN